MRVMIQELMKQNAMLADMLKVRETGIKTGGKTTVKRTVEEDSDTVLLNKVITAIKADMTKQAQFPNQPTYNGKYFYPSFLALRIAHNMRKGEVQYKVVSKHTGLDRKSQKAQGIIEIEKDTLISIARAYGIVTITSHSDKYYDMMRETYPDNM